MPAATLERPETAPQTQTRLIVPQRFVRDWEESEVAISGGTSGIGRETAKQLVAYTGVRRVYLIGRNQRNFDRTMKEFGADIPDFDPSRVQFWPADVSKPETVKDAWRQAKKDGAKVTDFDHAAAGGLEPVFTLSVTRRMREIAKGENAVGKSWDITQLSMELTEAAVANAEYAWQVNFHGPRELLVFAGNELPNGGMFGNMSSTWATTLINVPGFYRKAVAEPKHGFEDEMERMAPELRAVGIRLFKNTAQLVPDTLAGRGLVDNFVPLLKTDERAKLMSYAVSKVHVARANLMLLGADPRTWLEEPKTLWVYSEPQKLPPGFESVSVPRIRETLDLNHPMFKIRTGFE